MFYLYDIMFIFDRCQRSWAAETPDKYERDWKYITYTFAKSIFFVMEKLMNRALVPPPQVTKVCLSCYLVLLSFDSKAR